MSVQKVSLCPFHCKPRISGVSLESPGLENIPQVPANRAQVGQNHGALKAVSASGADSVKVMGGYILAQKLEIERSKSFAGSILLQTKGIRN